ncbi:MAG: RsmD family RNA methyltransferase [Phycisphaeraceae bacterium]
MRIIAGIHRGRRLLGPKDATTTRPITDRVKQSLFDRLWSQGILPEDPRTADEEPVDARGLAVDVFGGTGSLGLEALSRGIGKCVFVEQDREAVRRLEANITELGLGERSRVLRVNALTPTWVMHSLREPARVVFMDPPYAMVADAAGWQRLTPLLEALAERTEEGGMMVLRVPKRVDPPAVSGWEGPETFGYGSMKLSFYVR